MTPTWDILIGSVVHRTELLAELLAEFDRQITTPQVRVRVCRDNLELGYGDKCQRLLDSSTADYVCFVDDDDLIHADYVRLIADALKEEPDYVGFNVHFTIDGTPQPVAIHSLRYDSWHETPDALCRDISHLNPIRRSMAVQSPWAGGHDYSWSCGIRALGCVKTEVYIDQEMYHYRRVSRTGDFAIPPPMADPPPWAGPDYGFVTWVT